MKLGNQKLYKRNLFSEEKNRPRTFGDDGQSLNKRTPRKLDPFDEMEMTFYRPSRNVISGKNL